MLETGKTVEIYALPDNDQMQYGGFHLNLADGLERSIIDILNPPWNIQGSKKSPADSFNSTGKSKKGESPKSDDRPEAKLSLKQEKPIPGKSFKVTIGKTYWKQGFFNVGVDIQRYFERDKAGITIALGTSGNTISGHINRSVNLNDVPRIMGGKELRDWFHANCKVGDPVSVDILSPTSIRVRR